MNHVKYLNYLRSMVTNGARCAPTVKFRIAQQKQNTSSTANWT